MKMANAHKDSLYKFEGVLWQPYTNDKGNSWLMGKPMCPTEGCRSELIQERGIYFCRFCNKEYACKNGYQQMHDDADRKWRGYLLKDANIYSLDLPPTKVMSDAEDENYWVQARLSEKGGKRMAVVYFGEKVKGEQSKKDYSQVFIDFEDEQLRFDKSNKNPMHILGRLQAEFLDSKTTLEKVDS